MDILSLHWVYTYLLFGLVFLLGLLPAAAMWGGAGALRQDEWSRRIVILTAPIVGYLVFHFVAYAIGSGFKMGLSHFARTWLVVALALTLGVFVKDWSGIGKAITQLLRDQRRLILFMLFIALPISGLHITNPMLRHGWSLAYATGDDASRYLMMIDYLQEHFWLYGADAVGPVHYKLGNRPLMHYLQAMPTALFGVPSYISYTISSAMAALMSVLALASLGYAFFRGGLYIALIVGTVVFGFYGFYLGLYYTGYLGQYFSLFPILLALTTTHWRLGGIYQTVAMVIMLAIVATSYSVGFAIVVAVMVALFHGLRRYFERQGRADTTEWLISLLLALVVTVAIFSYEVSTGQPGDFLGKRNPAYDYGLLKSLLVMGGMEHKWASWDAIQIGQMWSMALPLLGVWALSLWLSWRMRKQSVEYLVLAYGITAVVSLAYVTGNFYLLNKTSVLVIPILVLALPALGVARMPEWLRIGVGAAAFSAWIAMAVAGNQLLNGFYVATSEVRHTNIDSTLIGARDFVRQKQFERARIYSADFLIERVLLVRQFFKDAEWQPIQDKNVWDTFQLWTAKDKCSELCISDTRLKFNNYDFDLAFLPKDQEGPVRLVDGNAKYQLYDGGWFGLYGPESNLVEFDANWDWQGTVQEENRPGFYRIGREAKNGGDIIFVNNHGCDRLVLRVAQMDMLSGLGVTINGGRIPIEIGKSPDEISIACGRYMTQRVNRIRLTTPTAIRLTEVRF